MKNHRGFVTIDRQTYLDNPIFYCERFDKGHAYYDLIMFATHTNSFFFISGHQISLKRGQIARSQKQLAERWMWDVKTVNKFLKTLEKNKYIVYESFPKKNPKLTIITLLQYDVITHTHTGIKGRMETGFPSGMHYGKDDSMVAEMGTYNKEKNDINEKNDYYVIRPIEELEDLRDQIHKDLDRAMKDVSDEDYYLAVDILMHFYISCKWNYFPEEVKTPMPEMIKIIREAFRKFGTMNMKNQFLNEAGYLTFGDPDEFENATSEEVFLKKLSLLDAQKKGQINAPTNLV